MRGCDESIQFMHSQLVHHDDTARQERQIIMTSYYTVLSRLYFNYPNAKNKSVNTCNPVTNEFVCFLRAL